MRRARFQHDGLTLSYLDSDGDGQALTALHLHWMEAVTYTPLAAALAPSWRVIALDQRGHGYSDHAQSYTRENYFGDLLAFLVTSGSTRPFCSAIRSAAREPLPGPHDSRPRQPRDDASAARRDGGATAQHPSRHARGRTRRPPG